MINGSRCVFGALAAAVCLFAANVPADETPMIPVGLDAYRMWERWPYQRIGARAYMRSTYDRSLQRQMTADNAIRPKKSGEKFLTEVWYGI